MMLKHVHCLLLILRCFASLEYNDRSDGLSSSDKICVQGPYLFEEIENLMPEGIGMKMTKFTDTLYLAKYLNISHIFNTQWLVNEHHTSYDKLFDFAEDPNCQFEHVTKREQHPHIRFVYINPYDELPPAASALCGEFTTHGFISQATFHRHSIFRQILDAMESSTASTVIVIPRNYHHNLFEKSSTTLSYHPFPDCLGLISTAFYRRKEIDLQQGRYRFTSPEDKLIVAMYMRWGDRAGQYKSVNDTGIQNCIAVLNNIFNCKHSVLNNFHDYFIYFVAEPHHVQGLLPSGSTEEFDFVKTSFPPGKVQIRADHGKFLTDLDILTSANVFTVPHTSTFISFQLSLMDFWKTTACRKTEQIWIS